MSPLLVRSRLAILLATALSGALLVGSAGAAPTATGPGCQPDRRTVRFTASGISATALPGRGSWVPCVVDTGMTAGETGLGIDAKGTLLRSVATAPLGIAVSSDSGASWTRRALPSGAPSSISDSYLDPITNRYFYAGASNSLIYFSDDLGKTWGSGTFDSTARQDWDKTFSGRPVVARKRGYPTNIYYCNWNIPLGVVTPVLCYKSTDGGKSFVTTGPAAFNPQVCADPTQHPSPNHGRGIVDPRDGTVYIAANVCGHQDLAVSTDEGKTWTHRINTASQSHVPEEKAFADVATSMPILAQEASGKANPVPAYLEANENNDNLAMDGRGRLYNLWTELVGYLPVISTSDDKGKTWSAPFRVAPPGVQLTALPALAVTKSGRVGVSFMGSTDGGATFTGYLSVVEQAGSAHSSLQSAPVTRPGKPLMAGPCCWANGPEEYTAARWAPDGSLYAAFAGSRPSGDAEGFVGRLLARR